MTVPGPLALTPEIEAFRKEFEQISADADALVAPLSDRQLVWQPAPDSWSVAQCLDHLNSTARVYLPMLDEGIANAIKRGMYAPGPYSYSWVGRLLVHHFGPTTRVRVKTMKPFQPLEGRSRHEIMAAFRAYQVQYVDRLRQANGLDLARARVSSPLARWLRFPLGSAFGLMAAHERRHLAQARRVIGTPGFPLTN